MTCRCSVSPFGFVLHVMNRHEEWVGSVGQWTLTSSRTVLINWLRTKLSMVVEAFSPDSGISIVLWAKSRNKVHSANLHDRERGRNERQTIYEFPDRGIVSEPIFNSYGQHDLVCEWDERA